MVHAGENSLASRVGIVTGGSQGIGQATTQLLSTLGTRVVAVSRHADPSPPDAWTAASTVIARADVRVLSELEAVVATTIARWGQLDFVVACAGASEQASLVDGDPQRWGEIIDTNLLGVANTARVALHAMMKQRSGDIVIVASVAGREVYAGEPVYLASKWGAVGLGRALRKEALEHEVRVSLVEPGLVDTPLTRANPIIEGWLDKVEPLQPIDVARAIAFALQQPPHVAINEIVLRPLRQEV